MLTRVLAAVHDADPRIVVGPVPPDLPVQVHSTREDPPGGGPVAATSAGLALVPPDVTFTALLAKAGRFSLAAPSDNSRRQR